MQEKKKGVPTPFRTSGHLLNKPSSQPLTQRLDSLPAIHLRSAQVLTGLLLEPVSMESCVTLQLVLMLGSLPALGHRRIDKPAEGLIAPKLRTRRGRLGSAQARQAEARNTSNTNKRAGTHFKTLPGFNQLCRICPAASSSWSSVHKSRGS